MFTQKHYIALADILNRTAEGDDGVITKGNCCAVIAGRLCKLFKEDNPKFNENKFLEACGF